MVWTNSKIALVFDSNEYIFFFNQKLWGLENIIKNERCTIVITEFIIKEVLRNLAEHHKKEFYQMLLKNNIIIHSSPILPLLLKQYAQQGLKKGDILIAAFCHQVNADFLVTENRHFLKTKSLNKCKIITLNECIKIL